MSDDRSVESLLDADLACHCASPYDSPAARWLLGGEFHPGGDALTRRLADHAGVRPGWRVRDVASGRGPTARVLASELNHLHRAALQRSHALARSSVGRATPKPSASCGASTCLR